MVEYGHNIWSKKSFHRLYVDSRLISSLSLLPERIFFVFFQKVMFYSLQGTLKVQAKKKLKRKDGLKVLNNFSVPSIPTLHGILNNRLPDVSIGKTDSHNLLYFFCILYSKYRNTNADIESQAAPATKPATTSLGKCTPK